jgi:hypothetical protein
MHSVVLLVSFIHFAVAVQISGSQTTQIAPEQRPSISNLSSLLSPSNQPTLAPNATTLDVENFDTKCDGDEYGINLDIADCEAASRSFPARPESNHFRGVWSQLASEHFASSIPMDGRFFTGHLSLHCLVN